MSVFTFLSIIRIRINANAMIIISSMPQLINVSKIIHLIIIPNYIINMIIIVLEYVQNHVNVINMDA